MSNQYNDKPTLKSSCEICGKSYKGGLADLNRHMKMVHYQENSSKCDFCKKDFINEQSLATHMKIHRRVIRGKIYQCEQCLHKFSTAYTLMMHMKSHREPKKEDHVVQVHSDEKYLACSSCSRIFSRPWLLKSHAEHVHMNTEPSYGCSLCPKVFKTRRKQELHTRRHTKQNFPCS